MTQTELARAIGLAFQQVQKYETGVNRIAAGTLAEIALVLIISPAALLPSTAMSGRAGQVFLDMSEAQDLLAIWLRLTDDGRTALMAVAKSLQQCAGEGRRRPT